MKADLDYNTVLTGATNKDLLVALESFLDAYKERATRKEEPSVPLEFFSNRDLGVLEVAVKYFKENLELSYSEIADMLSRDDRTVWVSYKDAASKFPAAFKSESGGLKVPCRIFHDRTLAPLEALVIYLHEECKMSFKEMADMLKRSYRTVWLSHRNGMRKKSR